MSLLALPAELRLRIYDYMTDLQLEARVFVAPSTGSLTPAICRCNKLLRDETLPLYARSSHFCIDMNDHDTRTRERVRNWTLALGPALREVRALRFSRAWDLSQPSRGQGHVGFYLNLDYRKLSLNSAAVWYCSCGTYPVYHDLRGMRLESVELLRQVVLGIVNCEPGDTKNDQGIDAGIIDLILGAMDVVAAHPISTYDIDQSDDGRRRRRQIWDRMERQLHVLTGIDTVAIPGYRTRTAFHTPY